MGILLPSKGTSKKSYIWSIRKAKGLDEPKQVVFLGNKDKVLKGTRKILKINLDPINFLLFGSKIITEKVNLSRFSYGLQKKNHYKWARAS